MIVATNRQSGFGLLEVLVATGILATVVTASVSLLTGSLRRAGLSAERAVAMNLAQEGIELVRASRDTAAVDQLLGQWDGGLDVRSSQDGTLTQPGDAYGLSFGASPTDGSCCYWSLGKSNPANPALRDGVESISLDGMTYQREIYVTLPPSGYPAQAGLGSEVTAEDVSRRIHVIVRWGPSPEQAVESITYLTNWRRGA